MRKLECIGHIQKGMGNRLCKLKKSVKGLGGNVVINDAGLFHVASSKNRLLHDHCPKGKDSWCGYQLDVAKKRIL